MLAPYSYRVSSIHLSHITKEASGDVCDGSRPCNCFGRDTIANAVAKVAPAVVYISFPEDYRGIYTGTRECTGTIINKDGTILTCAHMFDPKRHWGSHGKIEVILQDGRRFQGNILDADMHADIAILKINSEIPLPVAKLGSSSGLHPGDWGGSGSPLVNMDGEVVGVCLMTVEGARAFSFAVPIDAVHKITEQFKKSGINPISWSDISKEPSGAFCDESKPHGCFGRHAIASAVAKVGPSVVSITAPLDFFGIPTGTSRGTGTIVYKDGIILTSAHVVDFQSMIGSCRGKVEVTLQDGKTFKGRVLHADRDSDIAIVDINPESPLPEAKIGSSSGLRPGDWVIGLGCPPTLEITATTGIVSCTDRTSEELHSSGMPRKFIQTDCACHVGYSGGPLVNMDGEVIGLNIMKVKDVDGFCFSLPIDFVCKTVEHFKKSRR
ncbi:putative protease Do-like 14 isoform X2 [Abrus precatorius]|uniref:Protease Do-like 14 isoform X2 n=1 Tax=Abrus precatorius TaxID=3816 RepID=A0A8B8LC06_ABRPR|nr:putative protease Do-like 14 isoform X2 [Abrus precatorius]